MQVEYFASATSATCPREGASATWANTSIMLKDNASQAMDRLCAFYRRLMPDRILATITVPSPGYQALVERYHLDTEHARPRAPITDDLDLLFDLAEANMADQAAVRDDSIPSVSPNSQYGDYIFGALLGAPITFYGTDVHTWSWTEPLVTDWGRVDELRYDPEGEWTQRCLDNLRYGVERGKGRYALSSLLAIESLNLCVMLCGAQPAYTAIYDRPDALRTVMAFGVEFNAEFARLQREVIREHNEAVFEHPGFAAVSLHHSGLSLSVDAYDLCSPAVYRAMGREFQVELIRRCGTAAYHIHGDGRHLVTEVATLPGVICMNVQDDMHEILPRAFDLRGALRCATGDVPLSLACGTAEFVRALETGTLPGGTIYSLSAGSVEQANDLMRRLWRYRAPKSLAARALEAPSQ